MKEHQKRVIDEKAELDKKLERLEAFLKSEKLREVSAQEQNRLNRQKEIMQEYPLVLGERIEAFR